MEKLTRAEQALQTKNRIYETALKLFQEDNYNKVTISRICKSANVSVGNFYHYFKSKEDVLMEKYTEFDSWLDELDPTQDVEAGILAVIDLQTRGAMEIGSKVFVKVMEIHLSTHAKYISPDRKFNKYLSELAARGIQEGIFDPTYSPEEIAEVILRTSRGVLFDWSARGASYNVVEVAKSDVKIVLQGFHAGKADHSR